MKRAQALRNCKDLSPHFPGYYRYGEVDIDDLRNGDVDDLDVDDLRDGDGDKPFVTIWVPLLTFLVMIIGISF